MWCCPSTDITVAVAMIINHQEDPYLKRIVVRIMQNYANTTSNTIDNELVDEIERRLFPTDEGNIGDRDILIHFPQ